MSGPRRGSEGVERIGFESNVDNIDEEHDFADEHSGSTFADETADGPEHAREPDQPGGLAGLP